MKKRNHLTVVGGHPKSPRDGRGVRKQVRSRWYTSAGAAPARKRSALLTKGRSPLDVKQVRSSATVRGGPSVQPPAPEQYRRKKPRRDGQEKRIVRARRSPPGSSSTKLTRQGVSNRVRPSVSEHRPGHLGPPRYVRPGGMPAPRADWRKPRRPEGIAEHEPRRRGPQSGKTKRFRRQARASGERSSIRRLPAQQHSTDIATVRAHRHRRHPNGPTHGPGLGQNSERGPQWAATPPPTTLQKKKIKKKREEKERENWAGFWRAIPALSLPVDSGKSSARECGRPAAPLLARRRVMVRS